MKNINPSLLLLFIILSQQVFSQEKNFSSKVLDGVYIKETTPTRRARYPEHHRHRGNCDFYLFHEKGRDTTVNCIFWSLERPVETPPFKFKDAVFFNPAKKYICNFQDSEEPGHYFFLEGVKYKNRTEITPIANTLLPNSIRFYLDPNEVKSEDGLIEMKIDSNFSVPAKEYLTPFYFRKYEVTNAEYREFVLWVLDSILRFNLIEIGMEEYGQILTDTKGKIIKVNINFDVEIDHENGEVKEIYETLCYPLHERFYRKLSPDTRKLTYRFKDENKYGFKWIHVYPDTLCWVNDFNYSFVEPQTNMYFWHPFYDNYPVVGVSYYQALAYLEWRSIRHRKELKKLKSKYSITYDLPTEAQWDIVATATIVDKEISYYDKNYDLLSDDSWISDLVMKKQEEIFELDTLTKEYWQYYSRSDSGELILDSILTSYQEVVENITYVKEEKILRLDLYDKSFTSPSDITQIKEPHEFQSMNLDGLGISFMGGNVSEWLKDKYQDSYGPIFKKRLEQLNDVDPEKRYWFFKEAYYEREEGFEGNLVRGANWYDQRYGSVFQKNVSGMHAKTFVDPDKSHSTLGFRYVILIEEKEIND